jgi:hypothetical protein
MSEVCCLLVLHLCVMQPVCCRGHVGQHSHCQGHIGVVEESCIVTLDRGSVLLTVW